MKRANILALNLALRPESPIKIFPIGLSYVLSSVKRAGYNFELIDIDKNRYSDEEILAKLLEKKWDIVMLGCIVTGYAIVKKITSLIRRKNPKALIIAGNSVASSIPKILLAKTEVDVAVIGEGDMTIIEILNKWINQKNLNGIKGIYYKENGEIYRTESRDIIQDINVIPYPVYDIFEVDEYIKEHRRQIAESLPIERDSLRPFPVNTARGCINRCTFCYHCFIGMKYRQRSAENIVSEIKLLKSLYGINFALLWDDLTFCSKKQLSDFVHLLLKEKLEVYWDGAIRSNLFQEEKDLSLLHKMKDSGCIRLGYSLESADKEILRSMKKNVSLDQFRKQKRLMDKAGIFSYTSIVLGYPQETPETIAKTFQFCLDIGIYPSSGFLLPQPGTPIYEYAIKKGYITDEEDFLMKMGDRQDLRINLTNMSDQEFLNTVEYWLKKLNKELSINMGNDELLKTKYKHQKTNDR